MMEAEEEGMVAVESCFPFWRGDTEGVGEGVKEDIRLVDGSEVKYSVEDAMVNRIGED